METVINGILSSLHFYSVARLIGKLYWYYCGTKSIVNEAASALDVFICDKLFNALVMYVKEHKLFL